MTTAQFEARLAALEAEVARLKANPPANQTRWWEKIAGTFSSPEDRKALDEAMRLGRRWRASFDRPARKRSKRSR